MNDIINYISKKIKRSPDLAIVLGSGLADLQKILNNRIIIQYSDIPNYFNTTVKGHDGKFIFVTSSLSDYMGLIDFVKSKKFTAKIISKKKLFFEELILVKVERLSS